MGDCSVLKFGRKGGEGRGGSEVEGVRSELAPKTLLG